MFRKNKANTKPKKEKKEKKYFFRKKDKSNMDLEDSVANLDKQVNGVKEKKLVSVMPFKIARAFIWVLIGILCFRGGVSVFKGNQSEALKKENEKILNNMEKQSSLETQAFSFAEEFAWDYFSRYPSNTQDFVNRITKYTTEQLANEMNNGTYSDVIYTSAFYFEKYSENQVNVSVKARVRVYTPKAGQEETPKDQLQYDTNLVDYYLEVPIVFDKNMNMAVDALPVMTAPPEKAYFKNKEFSGTSENDADKTKKITDSVSQFFKAYYEQNQTQIDYFLVDGADIRGAGQKFSFNKIDRINIYKLSDKEFLAIVDLNVDSFGNAIKQGFNLTVVQEGDKFLVKTLEPRTSNIDLNNKSNN